MAESIPKDVQKEVLQIVDSFNSENKTSFEMDFRGAFAYLVKLDEQPMAHIFRQMITQKTGSPPIQGDMIFETKLGRLTYNGQMDNWDFAIFKHNKESNNSDDWIFSGAKELDGTIKSALKVGQELYI